MQCLPYDIEMGKESYFPLSCSASALRIFLVEDAPAVRAMIASELCSLPGIALAGCSDSENDALQQLLELPCDVLIIDIELKQGNGMSLLRKLRAANVHADALKIIFSNNICDAYRRAGERYGVRHFFDKSFDFPSLCTLLGALGASLSSNVSLR